MAIRAQVTFGRAEEAQGDFDGQVAADLSQHVIEQCSDTIVRAMALTDNPTQMGSLALSVASNITRLCVRVMAGITSKKGKDASLEDKLDAMEFVLDTMRDGIKQGLTLDIDNISK